MTSTQSTKTTAEIDSPGSGSADPIRETPVMAAQGRPLIYLTFAADSTSQVLVP